MGKEHPRAPAPAEMSKKRKALEGGGEPQLPEEEPTAWFEGSREEQGRGRGGRHRKEPAGEVWELRTSAGMFQPSSTAAALSGQLESTSPPTPQMGFCMCLREIGGGLGWS